MSLLQYWILCFAILYLRNNFIVSMSLNNANITHEETSSSVPEYFTLGRFRREGESESTAATADANASTDATAATEAPSAAPAAGTTGTPGFVCSVDLYQRFNKRCCRLPELIDADTIAKCNKANNNDLPLILASQTRGKSIQMRKVVVKNSNKNIPVKNSSITIPTNRICLTQCVFKSLRWLNKMNVLDDIYMANYLQTSLPAPWAGSVVTAREACDYIIKSDPNIHVVNNFGIKCILLPTKVLRCLKRYFLTNCGEAEKIFTDKQCQLDKLKLQTCDINML